MIRLAIIGFGRMGITHFSIINSHPDIKIVAVADTSSIMMNWLKKYIQSIKTYKDYLSLLKN